MRKRDRDNFDIFTDILLWYLIFHGILILLVLMCLGLFAFTTWLLDIIITTPGAFAIVLAIILYGIDVVIYIFVYYYVSKTALYKCFLEILENIENIRQIKNSKSKKFKERL